MELCFFSNMSSSEVAAWVQAIASGFAIYAVYSNTKFNIRETQKQKQLNALAILKTTDEFIHSIVELVKRPRSEDFTPPISIHNEYHEDIFRGYMRAVESIDLSDLHQPEAIKAMILPRKHLGLLVINIDAFTKGIYAKDNQFDKISKIEKADFNDEIKAIRYSILQKNVYEQAEYSIGNINKIIDSVT